MDYYINAVHLIKKLLIKYFKNTDNNDKIIILIF